MRVLLLFTSAVLLIAAAASTSFAQQQQYTVTNLGTLGGGWSQAWSINNSGEITGSSTLNSQRHAFLYKNGTLTDLGTLGGPFSDGMSISDARLVVGRAEQSQSRMNAFIFSNNQMVNIGTLPNDLDAIAFSINSRGEVAGLSEHNGSDNPFVYIPAYRGFLYRNGQMQDLSLLFGGARSRAQDINNLSQVVGSYNFDPFNCTQSRAFLYSNNTVTQLGILPGFACSAAVSINDAGEIVGILSAADDTSPHMFYYYKGVMQDLGSVGNKGAGPRSINNAGEIVGSFTLPSSSSFIAFIYANGTQTDLNSLIPANSGWNLSVASSINDLGQIVGWGYRDGDNVNLSAFLLTPTVPVLLTQPGTSRAMALNSVNHVGEPFPLNTPINMSSDTRTRIVLFARGIVLSANENSSILTVQFEDGQHNVYTMPVESLRTVKDAAWPMQVVVRLPEQLAAGGEVTVKLLLRGVASNTGLISVTPQQ